MSENQWLAERFEENRDHLRAVAYRMLGSASEADDAVQEAWLRLSRSDAGAIDNLSGWLTTVVARVSLDMLRSRASRREDALEAQAPEPAAPPDRASNPEQEALLADSVGLALLVVLDRLEPAERLAFVMHDMFAVPFEEIAPLIGRSPAAARQLASRARRRVQGSPTAGEADLAGQRKIVDAFLAALRNADFEGVLAVLDPDVVVRIDRAAAVGGRAAEIHGARIWAQGAIAFAKAARFASPALVDGVVGLVMTAQGRLFRALRFTFAEGRIGEAEIIADPVRLDALDVAVLRDI
jgi:RNA polymerase sigma-70 factor, ECF subfamily